MPRGILERWECACSDPPVLLATYTPGGHVQIAIGDRSYMASGIVHTICARCDARHVLDLTPEQNAVAS